ncbi:MAG: hypothetical protein ACRDRH_05505 [Pseudonocardia sp.]
MTSSDEEVRAARHARHDAILAEVAQEEAEAAEADIAEKAGALDMPLHLRIDRELDAQLPRRAAAEHIPPQRWSGACSGSSLDYHGVRVAALDWHPQHPDSPSRRRPTSGSSTSSDPPIQPPTRALTAYAGTHDVPSWSQEPWMASY